MFASIFKCILHDISDHREATDKISGWSNYLRSLRLMKIAIVSKLFINRGKTAVENGKSVTITQWMSPSSTYNVHPVGEGLGSLAQPRLVGINTTSNTYKKTAALELYANEGFALFLYQKGRKTQMNLSKDTSRFCH